MGNKLPTLHGLADILRRSTSSPSHRADLAEMLVFLALATATLWLFNRPYAGIWHDSIVYSLLAARHLNPENFVRELFFVFGSQDDFNLYTPVFAHLVSLCGLDLASRLVVLLGGFLWCAAFAVLGWVFFGFSLPMRWVTLFAATLSLSYSPNAVTFILNESFATARVLAMPLALLGIAADLNGRRYWGLGLTLLASALHPLLGVWALLAVACRRWPPVFLISGAGGVFVLIFVVGPLLGWSALQPMAEDWAQLVRHSSKDVFLAQSDDLKLSRALFWIFALCLGARLGQLRFQAFYQYLALMTASAYLLSLLCSYYSPVTLVMQAQPWRVLWLAICMGIFALLDVAWRYARLGMTAVLVLAVSALLIYALEDYAMFLIVPAGILLMSKSAEKLRACAFEDAGRQQVLMALVAAVLVAMLLPKYLLDLSMLGLQFPLRWADRAHEFFGGVIGGGMGLGVLAWAIIAGIRRARRFAILLVVPALAFAVSEWDVRSKRIRAMESGYLVQGGAAHPFAKYIEQGDVLAWPGQEQTVWFVLRAAHYASGKQGIGAVFSQEKTHVVKTRLERLAAASMLGEAGVPAGDAHRALLAYRKKIIGSSAEVENIHQYSPSVVTVSGAQYLCEDKALDWVVVSGAGDLSHMPVVASLMPSAFDSLRYSLVRCADLRAVFATAASEK